MPKLDREALQSLAAAGGGRYLTATLDDRDIEALAKEAPLQRSKTAAEPARTTDQWREEGPWLLLALLPLAAAAFRRGWLSPLLLLFLIAPAPPADAYSWSDLWLRPDQQAAQLLERGQPQDAAQSFQRHDWRAAAAYAAGDYQQALETLEAVEDPGAWYNRGNALARLGNYEKAIAAYDRALAANPDDADARHNRDLVRQLLEQQRRRGSQAGERHPQDADGQGDSSQQQETARSGQQGGQRNPGAKGSSQGDTQAPSSAQSGRQAGHAAEARRPGEQENPSAAAQQGQPASGTEEVTAEPAQRTGDKGSRVAEDEGEAPPASPSQGEKPGAETATRHEPEAQPERRPAAATQDRTKPVTSDAEPMRGGAEPGAADLLGNPGQRRTRTEAAGMAPELPMTEEQQAMEHQLNRVPDDPAGLLRQRFLLQHMRRTGQL